MTRPHHSADRPAVQASRPGVRTSRPDRLWPSGTLPPMTGDPAMPDEDRHTLEALAALDEVSPGELSRLTAMPARSLTRVLRRLREQGLVEGSQRSLRITLAGRGAAAPSLSVASDDTWEEVVGDLWPPYHGAFIRLMADATVIRALAPERRAHPGFVAEGAPFSYKSAMAEFVCTMFGLDRRACIVDNTGLLAPGAVFGRSRQVKGGAWVFDPAPRTTVSFVCFDELQDADPKVRREVAHYFHGETLVEVEGDLVRFSPTPLGCYNPPAAVFTAATHRRCVHIGPGALRPREPADLPDRLERFYAGARPAPVRLGDLALPATALPGELWPIFTGSPGVLAVLTERGRLWHDRRSFEALVLGRAARLGVKAGGNLRAALVGVVADLLSVAETVEGLVANANWRVSALLDALGDLPGADAVRAHCRRLAELRVSIRADVASHRETAATGDLDLHGQRHELMATYQGALNKLKVVPDPERARASGLRAQLSRLTTAAGETRSAEALVEVETLGAPVLEAARAMRAELDERARLRREAIGRARSALTGLGALDSDETAERDRLREALAEAANLVDQDAFDTAVSQVAKAGRRLGDRATARRGQKALTKDLEIRRRQAEAKRASYRKRLVSLRKRVKTSAGEDVVAVLEREAVVVRQVEERPEELDPPAGAVAWAWILNRPAPAPYRRIRRVVYYVDRAGARWSGPQLATWGSPEVLAAIDAALRSLDSPALPPAQRLLALPSGR